MSAANQKPARFTLGALLLVMVIGGIAWFVISRTPGLLGPKGNPAVQRIMDTYNELADKYLVDNHEKSPSRNAAALGELCDILERQDKSGCPRDFQVACAQNIRAIRDAKALLERMPENALGGAAMGAMNYLLRGEADGGLTRMHGEIEEALKRIRFTSDEVERIAAKYTN
jgi:hypothetical protein